MAFRRILPWLLSLLFLLSLSIIYMCEGDNGLTWQMLCWGGTDPVFLLDDPELEAEEDFLWLIAYEVRLPRLLCAASVGALLSVSGTIMQGLFRNPLVEPYTIGVSGGAVAGVAVAFASGCVAAAGGWVLSLAAAAGALLTMFLVLALRRRLGYDTGSMLMCGIMISFITSAATTLLMSIGARENTAQIIAWTIGSFETATAEMSYATAVLAMLVTAASPFAGNILNVIALGEDEAQVLGLNPRVVVGSLFTIATLLAAASVAAAGIVAFVGMMVPHLSRRVFGADHRTLLPASALCGASLMVVCDLVGKTVIYPRELPAGAISAIMGGVAFLCLTIKRKREL